jgi:hypothetical protein
LLETHANLLVERSHYDVVLTTNLRAHGVCYNLEQLMRVQALDNILYWWQEVFIEGIQTISTAIRIF